MGRLVKPHWLILVGLSLIIITVGWRLMFPQTLRLPGSFPQNKTGVGGILPVGIEIPSLNLKLTVTESSITDGMWEVADKMVNHLDVSGKVGQGNTVLYAHNTKNLFGSLRWIKPGAEVVLLDKDTVSYRYRVNQVVVVKPGEISYVLPKDEETLTLYTCTGFFDSQRLVVIARPLL